MQMSKSLSVNFSALRSVQVSVKIAKTRLANDDTASQHKLTSWLRPPRHAIISWAVIGSLCNRQSPGFPEIGDDRLSIHLTIADSPSHCLSK